MLSEQRSSIQSKRLLCTSSGSNWYESFAKHLILLANQSKQALTKKIFETFDLNLSETGSKNPVFHYYNCIRQLCEKHPDLVLTFSHLAIQEAHEDQKEEMVISVKLLFLHFVVNIMVCNI